MLVRGIIDDVSDIDIVCRGRAWEQAQQLGDFDIDRLIDSADIIAGLAFVRLAYVIEYKRIAGRKKDREHLRLLAAHETH